MTLDRKTFIRRMGAGVAALTLGRSLQGKETETAMRSVSSLSEGEAAEFWRAVRALYPLENDPVYLNTGGLGPASWPVLDRVAATMRSLQEHSETGHPLIEPARAALARFVGARPDEICFVRNATEGNSIIAAGLALAAGDEVIFETHAHPGGSFPWLNQAQRRGVVVKLFEPAPGDPAANLQRIAALVTPRTRVIQVSHVTCTTGLVLPVDAIAAFARARGIWFHVDGAQAVGMFPVSFASLGCDSYAFSGHKWLGGPHETGALYLRRDRLDDVALTGAGAYSGEVARLPGRLEYAPAASRHEYGTRNPALIAGLAEAARLQEEIGRERIADHARRLATRVQEELAGVEGLEVLTPRAEALRASIVTVRHARANAGRLFGFLLERHRLRCRPVTEQGLEAVRVSFHAFNSDAECTRVIAGMRAAARAL